MTDEVTNIIPMSDTLHPRQIARTTIIDYHLRIRKRSCHMLIAPEWYRYWLGVEVIRPTVPLAEVLYPKQIQIVVDITKLA